MSITITVNSSPLAGTEGKINKYSNKGSIKIENNVGINFEENENKDALMLEILLTQMRREGFMTVHQKF